MKTVDFSKKFKNYKGDEIGKPIYEELSMVLFNAGISDLPVAAADKFRAYKLSTKLISQNGSIDLNEEDVSFLKKFACDAFAAGAYGQILDLVGG